VPVTMPSFISQWPGLPIFQPLRVVAVEELDPAIRAGLLGQGRGGILGAEGGGGADRGEAEAEGEGLEVLLLFHLSAVLAAFGWRNKTIRLIERSPLLHCGGMRINTLGRGDAAACTRVEEARSEGGPRSDDGYLHDGHISLVARARQLVGLKGVVVASIYVNPTQFAAHEDLSKYPRDLAADLARCRAAGVDVVFCALRRRDVFQDARSGVQHVRSGGAAVTDDGRGVASGAFSGSDDGGWRSFSTWCCRTTRFLGRKISSRRRWCGGWCAT